MTLEAIVLLAILWFLLLGAWGFINDLLQGTPLRSKVKRPRNKMPERERELLGDDWTDAVDEWLHRRKAREERIKEVAGV